jgi:hypothetical protein
LANGERKAMILWKPSHGIWRVSQVVLAVSISIFAAGCMPFPRYAYLAQTRVEVEAGSDDFSAEAILLAKVVAADVAKQIGMKADGVTDRDIELERMISAYKKPLRHFLSAYHGTMSWGRPIRFRLEISDDERVLYFSISDYERGTPSPTVTRVRTLMMERVEAAFPDAAIVHEAQSLGPFFDSILDAHHAVQPPSTGITAPVT